MIEDKQVTDTREPQESVTGVQVDLQTGVLVETHLTAHVTTLTEFGDEIDRLRGLTGLSLAAAADLPITAVLVKDIHVAALAVDSRRLPTYDVNNSDAQIVLVGVQKLQKAYDDVPEKLGGYFEDVSAFTALLDDDGVRWPLVLSHQQYSGAQQHNNGALPVARRQVIVVKTKNAALMLESVYDYTVNQGLQIVGKTVADGDVFTTVFATTL